SVSCDTRRSIGMLRLVMMSLAIFSPMPWIYCSAITARLLVGRLTPAIRAKCSLLLCLLPAGRDDRADFLCSLKGMPQNSTRHPAPPLWDPASRQTPGYPGY